MNDKTQNSLIVVASGVIFGAAGFWLMPQQAKGALVGSFAGVAAATGHVRNDKRLRQIASRQRVEDREQQIEVHNLRDLITQSAQVTESISRATQVHETNIAEIKGTLQPQTERDIVKPNELNSIKAQLKAIESKVSQDSVKSAQLEHIKAAIEGLERKVDSIDTQTKITQKPDIYSKKIVEEAVEETQDEEAAQTTIEWFRGKGIEVENYYEPDPRIDALLDKLSLYLGDNYSILKHFHNKLRASAGKSTQLRLATYDSGAKRIHNQYLKKLISSDYLKRGKIVKRKDSEDFITATSYDRPDVKGFLDGAWFERFIYDKVIELFDSEGIDYQYLRNPKVVYPNGDLSELDLFFLVNGNPLLIECKATQRYHEGLEKFDTHRKRLNLNASNAIFVVLDIDETEAHLRNHHWNITVADQNDFLVRIKESIVSYGISQSENDEDEDEVNNSTSDNIDSDSLESFFKKHNLNLAPECRPLAFDELVKLMNGLDEPTNFNEISKNMRDNVDMLSRKRSNEILNCLRYTDMFRNQNNKPVGGVSKPISGMSSLKPKTFERKCMEFYARRILDQFDSDFFETEENIILFESLTKGSAPSPEKIRRIKESLSQ